MKFAVDLRFLIAVAIFAQLAGTDLLRETQSAADDSAKRKPIVERLDELEQAMIQNDRKVQLLRNKLDDFEKRPRLVAEGRAEVLVNGENFGRVPVSVDGDVVQDVRKCRIILTPELTQHNFVPFISNIEKNAFEIHVADIQSNKFTEKVRVHWLIIEPPAIQR